MRGGGVTAGQLKKLERACFEASAWSSEQLAGALARPGCIVVADEAGYVLGEIVLDEVELHRIGIAPAHRRAGHGRRLYQQFSVLAQRRGAQRLFLEVREDNVPARRLYEAVGLRPVGTRPRYYADGCAAIVYRCAFPAEASQ